MTDYEEGVRQSVRLPTVKLKPRPLMADGEERDSIENLSHYLAVRCISALLEFVQKRTLCPPSRVRALASNAAMSIKGALRTDEGQALLKLLVLASKRGVAA